MPIGIGLRNSAICAPVKTASTPSIACGGARVDRADAAVRDVAALERQVLHAGDLHVVHIGAAALDEAWILAALDALADELRKYRRADRHGDVLTALTARHLRRGVLDGVDDVLIAGAAAEVARDALADLVLGRAAGCP